jgi:hypothetical protein
MAGMSKSHDHPAKEPDAPGALALCWAMLRRLLALLATPGADKSIPNLIAELERAVCLHIFREALALDPSLASIDPSGLRLFWRNGRLDVDYADPAPALSRADAFRGSAFRAELREALGRLIALRRIPALHALRGARRFNRCAQIVISCERRRHVRRRRSGTHTRSRAPKRAHPLSLVPP